MHVGLIDVDGHNYPNLALMKLSAWHKQRGDTVEWHDFCCPMYDVVYMSKVFSDAYSPDIETPINAKRVVRGGTGYAIRLVDGKEVYDKSKDIPLDPEIEHIYPDYSLYPEYTGWGQSKKKQTAYGFLTRGCPRACNFCIVAPKEGRCSVKVADLSEFWDGQGNIALSDPNLLACKDRLELLQQLADSGAKIELNQGIDARLITPEIADVLAALRFPTSGNVPKFAMDTMKDVDAVARGLNLFREAVIRRKGKWSWRYAKVYMLVNFDTTIEQDLYRIKRIQECEFWPYVMRYNKPSCSVIHTRLARWTNNPFFYGKTHDFMEFQRTMYKEAIDPYESHRPLI